MFILKAPKIICVSTKVVLLTQISNHGTSNSSTEKKKTSEDQQQNNGASALTHQDVFIVISKPLTVIEAYS
jgi:hypothetical protein